jgi:para-nitrobenzyl esterase
MSLKTATTPIEGRRPLRPQQPASGALLRVACICAFLFVGSVSYGRDGELIKTENGLVQGTSDGLVTVYKGIPFAAPPVANLRWREPQPAISWRGVLKADAFKPMCMTSMPAIPGGEMEKVSEDCLYLNIWTPARRSSSKLPVMVWIYGGGDRAGSGSSAVYWGDKLVDKSVITVNLSYRVGSFGFLSHRNLSAESGHGSSGNYGVMDMVSALKWVRRNISAFGGDPHNVTIFGQSAGSFAVGYMMMSPLARGLFQRAIGESGADMGELISSTNAEASGARWASSLGAQSIAELRRVPADELEAADAHWPADATGAVPGDGRSGSIAVLDGYVFRQPMYETFQAGMQNDVPILIGYNANEAGDILVNPLPAAQYAASIKHEYADLAEQVLELYPASSDAVAKSSQLALMRDSWFGWQMWAWAHLQSTTGRGKVYFYIFSYVPHWPVNSPLNAMGAAHGFELADVFAHANLLPPTSTAKDKSVTEIIAKYWTNFAKSGNPNGAGLPDWPRFTADQQHIMRLGDPIAAGDFLAHDLRAIHFWHDFYVHQRNRSQ